MDSEVLIALIGGGVTLINVAISTISSVVSQRKTAQAVKDSAQDERLQNVEYGLQSLLRAEIIRSHDKYAERGYCPLYAKEALTKAHKAYHALGGNDVATRLYEDCMNMRDSKEEQHED